MTISSAVWFAAAAGIALVVARLWATRNRAAARHLDVGAVSGQWVARHRAGSDNNRFGS